MEERIHEPKAASWNDLNSDWVRLHNGKEYLLPVMSREQRYKPVFNADGSVTVEVAKQNAEFDQVFGDFLTLMEDYDKTLPWAWTDQMVGKFFSILRQMLRRNYEFTDEQMTELLSVNTKQLEVLFNVIFQHILRK